MLTLLIVASGACLLLTGCTAPVGPPFEPSGPPPEPRNLPGVLGGRVKTRWLAPLVSVTTRSLGTSRTATVQWLTPEGKVDRELAGPNVVAHPGYVYEYGEGKGTIHAVNGGWKIALPQKPGPAGYITATEDSHTFVHQFHPQEGRIAAGVYRDGKLVGTVGPFPQYQGQGVQLGADGSLALPVWKDADRKTAQVVGVGPDGKVRFRADCEGPVTSPVPAPDGIGILVQANAGGQGRSEFTFYTKAGKVSSLNVGPNAGFLTWLPGTAAALMYTSVGHAYRFHLIDWNAGERLWGVPDPNAARGPAAVPPVAVTKDHLLLGGLEYVKGGDRREPVRSIYALDPKTGRVGARWLPEPLSQPTSDGGRFLRLGRGLFLVTDEEVVEVSVEDITDKKNGWK